MVRGLLLPPRLRVPPTRLPYRPRLRSPYNALWRCVLASQLPERRAAELRGEL
eukprot:COSAG01_NODE_32008_length_587_cov_10.944672_1_plen_52_part_01